MYRCAGILCCLLVIAAFLGCGDSANTLPTANAGGTVTLNGQPVEGANVYFSPQRGGRAAYGVTDSRGGFRLKTSPTISGAMPGAYGVGIAKQRAEATAGKDIRSSSSAPKLTNELPDHYREPAKSGLKAEIKAGEKNEFQFDLKKD